MKRSELFFAFLQVPVDAAMMVFAFVASYYLRLSLDSVPGFNNIGVDDYLKYTLFLIPIWILLFAANGLYSIKNTTGFLFELYRIAVATSTVILFFVMIIFFTKTFFFSRLILGFIWVISIIALMVGRLTVRLIRKSLLKTGLGVRNVLLIGNNIASKEVNREISRTYSGFKVIGVLGQEEHTETGLKVIGDIDNLPMIIKKYSIDEVILTESKISEAKMISIIESCYDLKAGFKYIPDVFALMSANFRPGLIGSMPVMELKSIPLDGWGRIIKRILDIIFGTIAFIIVSPLFLIIALAIKLSTKGPILYSHQRVGRDDKVFNFFKFRSMYIDKCDFKGGVYWTTKEDENTRITPVGKFLRKTNLDELPQLWNIIKGDMSFVGPRPELPKLVEKFEKEIPEYFRRHKVKSGLTGWAQVNGFKGDTSIKERVRYDIYYIENWSLWFDFKIIIKTIWLVIYEVFNGKFEYRSRP
jgi:exopolysaccharide biosynthesis polyprenyl glycosylphosphotransferase